MLEWHVLFLIDVMVLKTFSSKFVSIFQGICVIFLYKNNK